MVRPHLLVHRDDLSVLQYVPGFLRDVAQVVGHKQRRREERPEGELGLRFGDGQAETTHQEHVWILKRPAPTGPTGGNPAKIY